MNIKNLSLDYIRYEQLNWYGHVRRMNEESLSQTERKKERKNMNGVRPEKEERANLKMC